jgi:hypothetical protein
VMRSTKMFVVTGSGRPIGRSRHADETPRSGAIVSVSAATHRR